MAEAAKLKRTGVLAGVSDLHLPYPSKGYHGLWIELKRRKGGRLTNHQRLWLDLMDGWGHKVAVCYGWDEAREILEEYLK